MFRTQTCGELNKAYIDQEVSLCGWVSSWRDHGGVVFIDLRDRYGVTQIVFNPETDTELHAKASRLRDEFSIQVKGKVVARLEGAQNDKLVTGEIEVLATDLTIFNESPTPPIEVSSDKHVSEEVRLKYRFLDLRRAQMQRNMFFRYRLTKTARDYLDENLFMEIETPYLTKSTPEGARDYLVPSRVMNGGFYALPQSPQLFKQILMVSGYDRYFQIVRCFRDEDLRADRQPEHTQIDMELSYVDQEDVMNMIEGMILRVFKEALGREMAGNFRRIPYYDAMNSYGSDKPDLRFDLKIIDVATVFAQTDFKVFKSVLESNGVIRGLRVPGGATFSRKDIDDLTNYIKPYGAKGLAWLKINEAGELESQIKKFFTEEELNNLKNHVQGEPGDLLLFVADNWKVTCDSLGALRLHLAKKLDLVAKDQFELCWVVDFPLVEWDEDGKRFVALHHPFTAPKDADLALLDTDPSKALAKAYDLVLNGTEIGGGSVRIHQQSVQSKMFSVLGIDEEEANVKFGFLLNALQFGAPPHAGIALGLDRLCAMLLQLDSIREVIAFPKTQKAVCPLTDAPSFVDEKQLEELSIRVRKPSK